MDQSQGNVLTFQCFSQENSGMYTSKMNNLMEFERNSTKKPSFFELERRAFLLPWCISIFRGKQTVSTNWHPLKRMASSCLLLEDFDMFVGTCTISSLTACSSATAQCSSRNNKTSLWRRCLLQPLTYKVQFCCQVNVVLREE